MSTLFDLLNSILPSSQGISPGATLAFFVNVSSGQRNIILKNTGTSGIVELLPCSTGASLPSGGSQLYTTPNFISGSTQSAAMLVALSGSGYPLAATEVLTLSGPCRFYLNNLGGVTNTVAMIKGIGSGN